MTEKIQEKVEVITIFRLLPQPKTQIYKIKWKGREYLIKEVAMHYTEYIGRRLLHKFSVSTGTLNFLLTFDTETLQWMLEKIAECE